MPTWTTPKQNWNVNEIVTAQDMNNIGENLAYLKTLSARAAATLSATNTTSTGFVTLASVNVTTRGGDVLAGFYAPLSHSAGGVNAYLDVEIDGTRKALGGTNGSLQVIVGTSPTSHSLTVLLQGISAGAHTVAVVWRTDSGTLSAGVGQMWALEV